MKWDQVVQVGHGISTALITLIISDPPTKIATKSIPICKTEVIFFVKMKFQNFQNPELLKIKILKLAVCL